MSDRPAPGIIPFLTIRDGRAHEALAFYQAAFGAHLAECNVAPGTDRVMQAALFLNEAVLMLSDEFPEYHGRKEGEPDGTTLHLSVDDADAWAARAVTAGAEVTMPIANQFWGDRYGQLRDPFGFRWSIGSPIAG
ncbi:VOC family protein [Sphingomonas sp. CROZ-RG-20F-R02-07]|uniref:VOC family protein n=1 Tax=Sphingomonas sp. CROZ-RG-20F-R02-07 TaxID=2914832 RepID=UPI001F59BF3E|nr:VOC family protein [Sphingomonas sp. CROZ-RG-20F-R02-07]